MLFYEDRQEGLGQDYFKRVSETIESIAHDPRRHPISDIRYRLWRDPQAGKIVFPTQRLNATGCRGGSADRISFVSLSTG